MSSHVQDQPHIASIKVYVVGFFLSLLLTMAAFITVKQGLIAGQGMVVTLLGLAVVQTAIQLWFFLHLGQESKPQWKMLFLFNTIAIILLIIIASIWIMNSLHYRMMSPEDTTHYMMEQRNKGF